MTLSQNRFTKDHPFLEGSNFENDLMTIAHIAVGHVILEQNKSPLVILNQQP